MSTKSAALFFSTAGAWEAMLAEIRRAKRSIDLEQYIFDSFGPGEIGRTFVDALIERARAGVKVRVLVDSLGSLWLVTSDVVTELTRAGVSVEWNTWASPLSSFRLSLHLFRNHRKVLVVDRARAFTGGVIIAERARRWRDTHLFVSGDAAQGLGRAFERHWNNFTKGSAKAAAILPAGEHFMIATNAPGVNRRRIRQDLLRAIRSSTSFIQMTTPYFAPDRVLLRALFKAVKRGVTVSVLLPYESDSAIVQWATLSQAALLLRHGIRVFQYRPEVLHAKTVVVDAKWGTVGSTNLDPLSLHFNHELNIHTTDPVVVRQLAAQFECDREHSIELTSERWRQRSLLERVKYDLIGAPISYII